MRFGGEWRVRVWWTASFEEEEGEEAGEAEAEEEGDEAAEEVEEKPEDGGGRLEWGGLYGGVRWGWSVGAAAGVALVQC